MFSAVRHDLIAYNNMKSNFPTTPNIFAKKIFTHIELLLNLIFKRILSELFD